MKLRVGVIGCGPIGRLHARIYSGLPIAELVGVCDIVPDRARACAEPHGVPWFADAREMIAKVSPRVVSVATGGHEYGSDHYEPTIQALDAGCHVLCEKPICNDVSKAAEMVARAREKKLCLAVDLNHRFTPAARQARRWLDEGRLGSLLFANMALWIGKPKDEESPWFHMKALNPTPWTCCATSAGTSPTCNASPSRRRAEACGQPRRSISGLQAAWWAT